MPTLLYSSYAKIDPALVNRTYLGETGCACGCHGDYTELGDFSSRSAWGRIKRVNEAIESRSPLLQVDVWTDEVIYSLENENHTRVTRVYRRVEGQK